MHKRPALILLLIILAAAPALAASNPKFDTILDFYDPNPRLLTLEGNITLAPIERDSTILPGLPTVDGFTADGVTEVLIRLSSPTADHYNLTLRDSQGGTAQVGALRTLGGNENTTDLLNLPSDTIGGLNQAFAVLRAPEDFVRPGLDDESQPSREIVVRVEAFDSNGNLLLEDFRALNVVRPPVVLLHGLWGDPSTWRWDWILNDDDRFQTYLGNYAGTHARELDVNTGVLHVAARRAVMESRYRDIAATQVDVVGHSMGGLIARLHANSAGETPFARPDNFNAGDINKLITLVTPHFGSPLADITVDANNNATPVGMLINPIRCVTCGAVRDLRTDSDALAEIAATEVPSYALIATGGNALINSGELEQVPPEIAAIVYLLDALGVLDSVYTPGVEHDLVVEAPSQQGGLDATHTLDFGYQDPQVNGTHTNVTGEERIGNTVIDLLNTPVADYAPGFPAVGPFVEQQQVSPAPSVHKGLFNQVTITEPEPGLTVPTGSTIPVSAATDPFFDAAAVILYAPFGSVVRQETPFAGELTLPEEYHGQLEINAAAINTLGAVTFADPVVINITTTTDIQTIRADPSPVFLWNAATTEQLRVSAVYGDGVTRGITASQFDTVYSSTNTNIVRVTAEGHLSRAAPGQARVIIQNGTHSTEVPVIVLPPCDGDINGDFVIDSTDLFLLVEEMNKTNPNPNADLNNDGTVDNRDLFELSRNYGTFCGQ